jgi:hypothetical protein
MHVLDLFICIVIWEKFSLHSQLAQKSDFHPSTIKPDNGAIQLSKPYKFGPLSDFKAGFSFYEK